LRVRMFTLRNSNPPAGSGGSSLVLQSSPKLGAPPEATIRKWVGMGRRSLSNRPGPRSNRQIESEEITDRMPLACVQRLSHWLPDYSSKGAIVQVPGKLHTLVHKYLGAHATTGHFPRGRTVRYSCALGVDREPCRREMIMCLRITSASMSAPSSDYQGVITTLFHP